MKILKILWLTVIPALSVGLVVSVFAYQEKCEELFYDGFDACGMDYRSEDPHYYTQVQKNHWDRTMELKLLETKPRTVIKTWENESLAIGSEGLWLNSEIVFHYPNNLTSHSTVSGMDYFVNGKMVRNFYGYDETNPTINFTTIQHSCIEFDNGEKTGIDVYNKYGIYTIGCEEWMLK